MQNYLRYGQSLIDKGKALVSAVTAYQQRVSDAEASVTTTPAEKQMMLNIIQKEVVEEMAYLCPGGCPVDADGGDGGID